MSLYIRPNLNQISYPTHRARQHNFIWQTGCWLRRFLYENGTTPGMTAIQDDLLRSVALACFSCKAEDINPDIADRAWELSIYHAEVQGMTPAQAEARLWQSSEPEATSRQS